MSVTGTLSDLVTEAENSLTEPSVGQRDGAPAETDSDSGDSLFITQKPVPEAVRPGRRKRSSFRSDPPSLTDADGSDDSASPEESKTDRKMTVKRIKLPKYSFSFLKQRRIGRIRIEELKIKQNTSLHSAVMGGFFKSVRDVWQSHQRKKNLTSLPTVDMPKESILPISEEEEEEKPEDEDIRVVEKKRFVVPLKAKCSQSWCTSSQGGGQEKKQRGRRSMKTQQETSQGGQQKMLAPKSREILSTCTSSDEEEESSSRALVERKTSDKLVASNTRAAETPKTDKRKENEDESSSASVCELSPNGPEASTDVAEPQEDVFLTDELPQTGQAECEPEGQNLLQTDANDDTMCSESRVKKKIEDRRGHEAVEEEEGQSQHDVSLTEVEETPSASQTIAELEIQEIKAMESLSHDDNIITVEERDIPDPKKKKKMKKKNKLAAEDVREEEDGPLESDVRVEEEDGVFSGSCNVENGGKEKKKNKKRNKDDELLKSNLQSEPLNGVAEKPKKKKKKKKKKKDLTSEPAEQLQEVEDCLEEATQETGESGYVEGKKHKKKQKTSSGDHDGEDCIDVSFSNEVITGVSVKKKNTEEDENVDNAQNTTEGGEDQDAELLRILSEDAVAQSDDSVSVWKKKKKRTSSFLVADAEENAAQTHEETPSVAAYSWPTVKPAGESAETTGSLEKADDGVRKKKKKRKKVSAEQEKAEKDFEEPDRTCQTAVAETDDEKKKKRRRDDSESVTSVEIVEKASDSQAAKQKKKKKKKDIREIPSATAENNESEDSKRNISVPLSHKKKSSTVAAKGINETCNDSRAANDQAALEALAKQASPSSETPENQAGNDGRGKKKKQKVKAAESVLLQGKSFVETDEIKAPKPKKKDRTQPAAESSLSSVFSDSSLCQSETSSSHSGRKNKHKKAKHRHFNQMEDFITDG